MISPLFLSQEQCDEILRHAAEHVPLEACGLLAGNSGRVKQVIFVRNQAQSPTRYVMDPYEQLRAFEWIDSQGMELIGIFHSHPAGPEMVSATDIQEAAYEVVYVICSRPDGKWKMRGYWIGSGQAYEVPISIQQG